MNLKLLAILTLSAFTSAGSVSNFQDFGAACSYLNSKESLPSKFTLRVDLAEDVTVPYLIFHYRDLLNFTNVPTMGSYFSKYEGSDSRQKLYEQVLEDGEFKLALNEGFELDQDKIWKGKVEKKAKRDDDSSESGVLIELIPKSGVYCMYIAPPPNTSVHLAVKQSHGYLPYINYLMYSQNKIAILIAIGLFAYLLHYTIQFKIGPNFSNLNSLSLISRAMVFYVLPPFILLWFIDLISGFVKNHVAENNNYFFHLMDFSTVWLNQVISVMLQLFILLFSMGYGVIYCLRESQNYLNIPRNSQYIASALFFGNIVAISLWLLQLLFSRTRDPFSVLDNGIVSRLNFENKLIVFNLFVSIFPLLWFITSMVFYFKTKKTLAKFPPVSSLEENAVVKNNQTVTSFRRSILVIFVLPVFISFLGIGIGIYKMLNSDMSSLTDLIPQTPQSPSKQAMLESVLMVAQMEMTLLTGFLVWAVWTNYLNLFLTIGLIFAIWIKTNAGIVLVDEGFDEIAQHVTEDEDDLRL